MNEAQARGLLQAVLNASGGRAATYVPLAQAISASKLNGEEAAEVIKDLADRRWIHLRGQSIAVAKLGVEFAIDWPRARQVLEAIRDVGQGQAEASVEEEAALARAGLPRTQGKALLNELILLGVASRGMTWDTQVPLVKLTDAGLDYLRTGQPPALPQ